MWIREIPHTPGHYFVHRHKLTRVAEVVAMGAASRGPGAKAGFAYWVDGGLMAKSELVGAYWWKIENPPDPPETNDVEEHLISPG